MPDGEISEVRVRRMKTNLYSQSRLPPKHFISQGVACLHTAFHIQVSLLATTCIKYKRRAASCTLRYLQSRRRNHHRRPAFQKEFLGNILYQSSSFAWKFHSRFRSFLKLRVADKRIICLYFALMDVSLPKRGVENSLKGIWKGKTRNLIDGEAYDWILMSFVVFNMHQRTHVTRGWALLFDVTSHVETRVFLSRVSMENGMIIYKEISMKLFPLISIKDVLLLCTRVAL